MGTAPDHDHPECRGYYGKDDACERQSLAAARFVVGSAREAENAGNGDGKRRQKYLGLELAEISKDDDPDADQCTDGNRCDKQIEKKAFEIHFASLGS